MVQYTTWLCVGKICLSGGGGTLPSISNLKKECSVFQKKCEFCAETLRDNNIIVDNHMLVNITHLLQAVRMGIYHTAFYIAITYTILQQVSTILNSNLSTFESCHMKTGL